MSSSPEDDAALNKQEATVKYLEALNSPEQEMGGMAQNVHVDMIQNTNPQAFTSGLDKHRLK
jgi:hypothetical protein